MGDKRKEKSKKDIYNSLTSDQKERVDLMIETDNKMISNEYAHSFAIRCDPVYQNFNKLITKIRNGVEKILSSVYENERDKQKILSESFEGTMKKRDYELAIMLRETNIGIELRTLWMDLAGLYQTVDIERIDRKIFFTGEQYDKFVKDIQGKLKSAGIDLYQSPL